MATPKRKGKAPSKKGGVNGVSLLFKGVALIAAAKLLWRFLRWLFSPRKILGFGILAVVLSGGAVAWYVTLPYNVQLEVSRVTANLFDSRKEVTFADWAGDLLSFYIGTRYTACPDTLADSDIFNPLPLSPHYPFPLTVLRNHTYAVGYCENYGNPAWVAYRISDMDHPYDVPPRPPFREDARTTTRIVPNDYTGSGYDRGHLAPNAAIARCYGPEGQTETFLMSNIVPQEHTLNAGIWHDLERRVAYNYAARFGEAQVITGPVYYGHGQTLKRSKNKVAVPDAFYKIVLVRNHCGLAAYAYIFPHHAARYGSLADYLVSVDQIEQLTGLDFFPRLPTPIQAPLEANVQTSP